MLKNILAALDRKERKQFFILLMLDIVVSIIDILFLALLLWIIQFYIQPGNNNMLPFLPRWMANRDSTWFIAIFVILFAIKNLAGFAISRAYFKFINKVAIRVSHNSLVNYQQSAFREFINIDSSVHLRTICFRPFEFSQYMLSGLQQIITQLSLMLITIIAILLFNAKIFLLLLLILLPPVIIVFWFVKKRLAHAKKHIQATNERSFQYLMDALKGYVESNIYDRNDFFLRRFINSRKKFSAHLFESMALQTLPGRVIEIFAVLGLFILIVIAKWTGNNDSAMLITIGAFMAAAYKIIPGIVKVINVSGQMRAYEFSINDLEQSKTINSTRAAEKPADEFRSMELRNISFKYADQPVLGNFNLGVKKGDFIGITGRSGKGKTTILNLLLGFLPPGNGEVLINEGPVSSDEIKKYWPVVAYVRQQGFFIYDSILRNITLEETGYNNENLRYALNVSGLEKIISKFPEGLEKVITENGKNISGGQQQRISIARALYKNASLFLLDEPFNELDEESTVLLLEHFKQLAASGQTVVMITHDKKSLSYCSKIVSLDEQ
ncbi:MAG TPA: ABC transporter ATP-binding protein [Ferruginibacter sp.]|nr:ABC transporter ATP-binding protein [Ferruginibacter sp.]